MTLLPPDEQFVINALVKETAAESWRPGVPDPPDAILIIDGQEISVEITTLFQQVPRASDGKLVSAMNFEAPVYRLADWLNAEIGKRIPDTQFISIGLACPINLRVLQGALSHRIVRLIEGLQPDYENPVFEGEIEGHPVRISVYDKGGFSGRASIVLYARPPPDLFNNEIFANAVAILRGAITKKSKKCAHLLPGPALWLGLLDEYTLASGETYRRAMGLLQMDHPFARIIVVNSAGCVFQIYPVEP